MISSLLIGLFTLSITPKIVIHNLIAHHKDIACYSTSINGHQISKAGFNCHFENFVAESPFVHTDTSFEYLSLFHHSLLQEYVTIAFFSQHHFFSELRGPPHKA